MTVQNEDILERFVVRPDGIRIRIMTRTDPDVRSDLMVIIATGRTEFCEKYIATLKKINAIGHQAAVFDWCGQGKSARLLANRFKGHIRSFDAYLQDLETVVGFLAQTHSGPLCILGHSMGGHIALRALARWPDRFRGAVLSAPMIQIARGPVQTAFFTTLANAAVTLGLGDRYVFGRGDYGPSDEDFDGNVLTHDRARFDYAVSCITADSQLALGGPTWSWLAASQRSIAGLRAEAAGGQIGAPRPSHLRRRRSRRQ